MVDEAEINVQAGKLDKPMFWNYGRMAYGAALHLAEAGMVEGFICVTSFGCGIDSFVNDIIERNIRKKYNIPFITMTIDEHSGEAGFNTRLEAFVDMLQWRNRYENYIPSLG
jgi:predicted nucleotide-binding protein (sugar kinase/HSP70/actin superfamily)